MLNHLGISDLYFPIDFMIILGESRRGWIESFSSSLNDDYDCISLDIYDYSLTVSEGISFECLEFDYFEDLLGLFTYIL